MDYTFFVNDLNSFMWTVRKRIDDWWVYWLDKTFYKIFSIHFHSIFHFYAFSRQNLNMFSLHIFRYTLILMHMEMCVCRNMNVGLIHYDKVWHVLNKGNIYCIQMEIGWRSIGTQCSDHAAKSYWGKYWNINESIYMKCPSNERSFQMKVKTMNNDLEWIALHWTQFNSTSFHSTQLHWTKLN